MKKCQKNEKIKLKEIPDALLIRGHVTVFYDRMKSLNPALAKKNRLLIIERFFFKTFSLCRKRERIPNLKTI